MTHWIFAGSLRSTGNHPVDWNGQKSEILTHYRTGRIDTVAHCASRSARRTVVAGYWCEQGRPPTLLLNPNCGLMYFSKNANSFL